MAPVRTGERHLDNLLAQRTIEPFLVVMPLGYGGAHVNGDGTGIPPKGAGTFGGDAALYQRDLLEDIIPMIERNTERSPTASIGRLSAFRWEAVRLAVSAYGTSRRSVRLAS